MPYKDPDRQRKYQANWFQKRLQLRLAWLSDNGPCVDCGSWENLEIDHVDNSTKVGHCIWTWSEARRDAELAKCEPRCRQCHQLKTIRCKENPAQVLTEDDVRTIRRIRAETGFGHIRIARIMQLESHRKAVRNVITGKSWGHVK